jgi:hypothetical protein
MRLLRGGRPDSPPRVTAELEALEGRIDRSHQAWTTPQSVGWLAAGLSLETDQAVNGPQAFHDRLRLEAGGRGRGTLRDVPHLAR